MAAWTEDRIAEARRLWEEGWSASLIAEKINLTKGQVVGRAYRERWGQRQPLHARPGTPEGWLRQPEPPPPVPMRPHASPRIPGKLTLLDLKPHECKWPMNDVPRGSSAYLFCGKPQFNGHPYCEHHARLGFSGKGTARRSEVAGWQPRAEGWR